MARRRKSRYIKPKRQIVIRKINVARRGRTRIVRIGRRARGGARRLGGLGGWNIMNGFGKGLAGSVMTGIGGSEIAGQVADRVAPQYSNIARPIGGLAGGVIGVIAGVALNFIKGKSLGSSSGGGAL